jgi:hypothetical protein
MKDEKLFCRSCYEKTVLEKCDVCKVCPRLLSRVFVFFFFCFALRCFLWLVFYADLAQEALTGEFLSACGKKYHPRCFVCTKCKTELPDKFFVRDNKPYCAAHASK